MPIMPIRDGALYYEVHGTGAPLLLVSGLGGVGSFWAPQLPALTQDFRVVIHDHRGTGKSSRDTITYAIAQMAEDVLALADGLGIETFHFAGHSTGSAIGQYLMLHHPKRLAAAVLSSGWARKDPWFDRCFAAREQLLQLGGPEAYVRAQALFLYPPWWVSANAPELDRLEAAQRASLPPAAILLSRIAALMEWDPGDALTATSTPALVVCADDDHLTPPHFSLELHRLLPGSGLAILPTGGHFNPTLCAAEFNQVLAGWLLAQLNQRPWSRPAFARQDTRAVGMNKKASASF